MKEDGGVGSNWYKAAMCNYPKDNVPIYPDMIEQNNWDEAS